MGRVYLGRVAEVLQWSHPPEETSDAGQPIPDREVHRNQWRIVDKQGRALHDIVAKTRVVRAS